VAIRPNLLKKKPRCLRIFCGVSHFCNSPSVGFSQTRPIPRVGRLGHRPRCAGPRKIIEWNFQPQRAFDAAVPKDMQASTRRG
jgi:hypothetical protein